MKTLPLLFVVVLCTLFGFNLASAATTVIFEPVGIEENIISDEDGKYPDVLVLTFTFEITATDGDILVNSLDFTSLQIESSTGGYQVPWYFSAVDGHDHPTNWEWIREGETVRGDAGLTLRTMESGFVRVTLDGFRYVSGNDLYAPGAVEGTAPARMKSQWNYLYSPVPEPHVLMFLGLLPLFKSRRRKLGEKREG